MLRPLLILNTDGSHEGGGASSDAAQEAERPTVDVDTPTSSQRGDASVSSLGTGGSVEAAQLDSVWEAGTGPSRTSTSYEAGSDAAALTLSTGDIDEPGSEPVLLDYDRDGLADEVDTDDDDDGLSDQDELATSSNPLDPRSPVGHTSSHPGSVLSDPCVQAALAEYAQYRAERGIPPLAINLHHTQTDLSGYYVAHNGDGFKETSNTGDSYKFDLEIEYGNRRLPGTDDVYENWGVGVSSSQVSFYWFRSPRVIRANGDSFTVFAHQEDGSVLVQTMDQRTPEGDFLFNTELWISVSNTGLYPGGVCNTSGERWGANYWSQQSRAPVAELAYMCRDDVNAYVPDMPGVPWQTESESCSCAYSAEGARLEKTCTPLPPSNVDAGSPSPMRLE